MHEGTVDGFYTLGTWPPSPRRDCPLFCEGKSFEVGEKLWYRFPLFKFCFSLDKHCLTWYWYIPLNFKNFWSGKVLKLVGGIEKSNAMLKQFYSWKFSDLKLLSVFFLTWCWFILLYFSRMFLRIYISISCENSTYVKTD